MTNDNEPLSDDEKRQRTMDFILAQQAQFEINFAKLEEAGVRSERRLDKTRTVLMLGLRAGRRARNEFREKINILIDAQIRAEEARQESATRHDAEMAEIRVAQKERAARHDAEITEIRVAQKERAARHDTEMAEIREALRGIETESEKRAANHDAEITEIRTINKERAARHDTEMAEIREALHALTLSAKSTNERLDQIETRNGHSTPE